MSKTSRFQIYTTQNPPPTLPGAPECGALWQVDEPVDQVAMLSKRNGSVLPSLIPEAKNLSELTDKFLKNENLKYVHKNYCYIKIKFIFSV